MVRPPIPLDALVVEPVVFEHKSVGADALEVVWLEFHGSQNHLNGGRAVAQLLEQCCVGRCEWNDESSSDLIQNDRKCMKSSEYMCDAHYRNGLAHAFGKVAKMSGKDARTQIVSPRHAIQRHQFDRSVVVRGRLFVQLEAAFKGQRCANACACMHMRARAIIDADNALLPYSKWIWWWCGYFLIKTSWMSLAFS